MRRVAWSGALEGFATVNTEKRPKMGQAKQRGTFSQRKVEGESRRIAEQAQLAKVALDRRAGRILRKYAA